MSKQTSLEERVCGNQERSAWAARALLVGGRRAQRASAGAAEAATGLLKLLEMKALEK